MSLLVDIASQAVDPGYAAAAARRDTETPPVRRRHRAAAVAAIGAAAALLALAAAAAHASAPDVERSQQALLDRTQRETTEVTALQGQLDQLRARTSTLRNSLLTTSRAGAALADRLDAEELGAGTTAVHGPGLQVTLADAPGGSGEGNRVLDSDVQAVVNALWAAGAEAVSVDSQRLTAQTAIRQAGDAILVNFEPLSSPYVIDAVGDPVSLETGFATSPAAGRLRTLSQLYDLGFHYARADALELPAAPGITLRYAVPLPGGSAEGGSP